VKVNAPIATLIGEGESESSAPVDISSAMKSIKAAVSAEAPKPQAKPAAPAPERPAPQPVPAAKAAPQPAPAAPQPSAPTPTPAPQPADHRVFASPLARRVAQQKGVDIANLKGSGPRGRIVLADVAAATPGAVAKAPPAAAPAAHPTAPQAQPQPGGIPGVAPLPDARAFYKPGEYEEIPHDSMRKTIARRLTSAKTLIPHYYLTIDTRIDNLLATRARLNEVGKDAGGYKLSVNDFVVKAAALALIRVPEVNASWTDTAILRHKHADVGIAVALDFGLITPIIFRADEKGLAVISNEAKTLAEKARQKKLKPSEFEGGSFSISNLGMFAIKDFTAVINPPQSAILAVGAGEPRAVARDGKVEIATMMTVTMSCDHRVIDGATGARFLQAFRQYIEEPASMLL
jgi:pyruvate dehydrogenase E2 component (dihydrolipoamide acetyltransferase)